jgi:LysM repeat protein
MRGRLVLFLSLAANLVLAAGWFLSARQEAWRASRLPRHDTLATPQYKTNVVVRRQFFTWQEIETADYPTYIANLRDIGCPEPTIRDIIIADINALYARKRATEIVTPEQQWWRAEPDTNVLQTATAKGRELEQERRELLARLLGTNWESGDLVSLPRPSRPAILLDGPVLGALPLDVKESVQAIAARAQDRVQVYTEAQRKEGKPVDPAELARLQQQTRLELTQVLSPPQTEEFLLRYSQNASALRAELGQLKYFNATPDEFRAVFRATDNFDQQLGLLAGATDANSAEQRTALQTQRENALKLALGPERYAQYRLLQDPTYQNAYAAALDADAPEAVGALYDINQASAQELARIRANTNLTAEQRDLELKKAELEQLQATAQALGQELPPEPPRPPKPQPARTHVLANGESLSVLARLYGVDPNALRAANPNLNFDKLKPGDSVSVPLTLGPFGPVSPSPP